MAPAAAPFASCPEVCREGRHHIARQEKSTGGPPQGAAPAPCPLCGRREQQTALRQIPYSRIWARLAEEWQVAPSEDLVRRYSPSPETSLYECGGCGLRFFHPASPGGTDFYGLLAASPRYYSAWKWEFGWVREHLPPGAAVLDVGCGRGDFLAAVQPHVRRAAGLELDQRAAAKARARGLEIETAQLESFAGAHAGEFDAACLFHVVEHLADVRSFVAHVVACLRPGGSLYVSVPHRERFHREPFESLDCPPHHLSRWGPRQMEHMTRDLGLRLARLEFEPVDVAGLRVHFAARLERWCARTLPGGSFIGRWAARFVRRVLFCAPLLELYRRTRLFDRIGFRGFSMVTHYLTAGTGQAAGGNA